MSAATPNAVRGIRGVAAYLPHWRLQRSAITAVLGSNAGKGTRTVAAYDEDAVLGSATRPEIAPLSLEEIFLAVTEKEVLS